MCYFHWIRESGYLARVRYEDDDAEDVPVQGVQRLLQFHVHRENEVTVETADELDHIRVAAVEPVPTVVQSLPVLSK